jgi:hypothetical protein
MFFSPVFLLAIDFKKLFFLINHDISHEIVVKSMFYLKSEIKLAGIVFFDPEKRVEVLGVHRLHVLQDHLLAQHHLVEWTNEESVLNLK